MSFVFPELVIESVIRDGLNACRRDPSIVQDVFGNLTRAFANKLYGQKEINKINALVESKEFSLVHSFSLVQSSIPCVSIQLLDEPEDISKTSLGDTEGMYKIPFTDPQQLASLIVVNTFTPSSYNSSTGAILVPDMVDLSAIYANLLYQDIAGNTFPITGGIVNSAGSKQFLVAPNSEVDITGPGVIKSPINYSKYFSRTTTESVKILLGVHTRDALTTKYLYTLIKYFILSRKQDLIKRDFQLATYSGSDFTRNNDYTGDVVFSRFLTISGMVQQDWRSDLVALADTINAQVEVPADVYGNEELGLVGQTVITNKP